MEARLRNRFLTLLAEKEKREQRRIKTSQISLETGVTVPTVNRWLRNDVNKVEGPVLIAFCDYFQCDICDLIYIEREG